MAKTSETTLRAISKATAAVEGTASAALGILIPLRNARGSRIPPLCRCQCADGVEPPYER